MPYSAGVHPIAIGKSVQKTGLPYNNSLYPNCPQMDEQWGYIGAKSRQRWLFYAYDRIRRTVVAHVFGERTLATLERLLSLLSAFEVVV